MERIVMTSPLVGICHMQLCAKADVPDDELLAFANRANPSGTTLGWSTVVRSEEGKPVQCKDDPKRTHFLLRC